MIAHNGPVTRFVLDSEGDFVDLTVAGNLAAAITRRLEMSDDPNSAARRRESARTRFAWEKLAPAYADMFHKAAQSV